MNFSWDGDGNGIYDSSAATFTRSFLITTPQYRKICLVAFNCVGSDTACKNVLFLPIANSPVARIGVDKVQGFNTDTFRFRDLSLNGPSQWRWTFTPGTAQFLSGTSATSKNPLVRFTQRTKYTVKLVVRNSFGADSVTIVDYVNIGAYDQPACLSSISLADGSIGISRVRLVGGIDTTTNPTNPCYELIGGNQSANLYRGSKAALTITRPGISSPMDRKAWIDFNMDGLFTNDELVASDMNAQTLTVNDTVRVSNTQILGSTRMRVGVTYAGTQLNSSVTFLGVFKDFVVNFPQDTVKPVASLRGGSTVFAEINKPYNDSGIVATDNIEGNISAKYEIIGSVDNTKVGPNYLKYIVRDLYGNVSDTLYRTVFVIINQTGPSIILTGNDTQYVEVFNAYLEPGYQATNNNGANITNQVVVTSNLDTAKINVYTITYTIIDAFGLSAVAKRTVIVGDTTKPSITAVSNPYIHQVGTALDLMSVVRVRDNYWPANFVSTIVTGVVNVNQVGSYFVGYRATDNSNNTSANNVVEVRVQDTKPPVIVILGNNPLFWEAKTPFVDPGFTVTDNFWPINTIVVTKKGIVNTNQIGEYTIWYIATDPSGNKDSVSRVVKVRDTSKPQVDLLNIAEVNLPRWREYIDPPVALVDNVDSDSAMRKNLVISIGLPKNKDEKYFGDVEGLFSATYQVADLSGNQSDLSIRRIFVGPPVTALEEQMKLPHWLRIYPNPSNGLIKVGLLEQQTSDVHIHVLDLQGKELMKTVHLKNNLIVSEMDLTSLAKGIYLIKIQVGESTYYSKIQLD
jgi:PKD repeat protein